MEYIKNDLLLPTLHLPDPCPIKIVVDDKYVRLFIGTRDWQWTLAGEFVGSGISLYGAIPAEGPPDQLG